jgi:predicted ArsR family transcriptional regulator
VPAQAAGRAQAGAPAQAGDPADAINGVAADGGAQRATGDRLLLLLKTRGPLLAADLAAIVGISGEGARQQLGRLAEAGLVEATSAPRGVGRPAQVWALTAAAHARFPDTHAELTAQLLRAVRSELGEAALDRLIDRRAAESKEIYDTALAGAAELGERVARLAAARTREGYMAECRADGDGYLLIENHCPICVAATECQGFCRAERDIFRQVLGRNVSVQRTEHILGGDRRCTYRIAPQAPASPAPGQPETRGATRRVPVQRAGRRGAAGDGGPVARRSFPRRTAS